MPLQVLGKTTEWLGIEPFRHCEDLQIFMLRDRNISPQGKETKTIEPFGEQQNTVLSLLREMYCVDKNIQSQRKYNFVVQQINIDCFF